MANSTEILLDRPLTALIKPDRSPLSPKPARIDQILADLNEGVRVDG